MRILIPAFLFVLLLAACSDDKSEAQANKAGVAYIICLRQQAVALDDHTSDVPSVAASVVKACTAQFKTYVDLSKKSLSDDDAKELEARMNNPNRQLSVAADAVKYERADFAREQAAEQAAEAASAASHATSR